VTDEREEQDSKQLSDSSSTDEGMQIEESDAQFANA
jgi:hypothetical protein